MLRTSIEELIQLDKVFSSPHNNPNTIEGKGPNTKHSKEFDENKIYKADEELRNKLIDKAIIKTQVIAVIVIFIRLITYSKTFDLNYTIICGIASFLFGLIFGVLIGATFAEAYYTDDRVGKIELKKVKKC